MRTQEERENLWNEGMILEGPSAHWAAIIIQRAFRAHLLRRKFSNLMSLQGGGNSRRDPDADLDKLILRAAGLDPNGRKNNIRPSVRKIQRRKGTGEGILRRSLSLKNAERALPAIPRSKDDSEIITKGLSSSSQHFFPPPPSQLLLENSIIFTHERCNSSPEFLEEEEDSLPPPPPYVCPPHQEFLRDSDSPLPPPPPPELLSEDFDPDAPLPPPPPAFIPDSRASCGSTSSSSVSSVDSGYPYNDRLASPVTRNWVPSPTVIASPESAQNMRETVYVSSSERDRDIYGRIRCPEDIYGRISGDIYGRIGSQQLPKTKKTVRIQTPSNLPFFPPHQRLNQPRVLRPSVDDTVRKRQYRVGLNLFNQNPERGMEYLLQKNYVEYSPSAVAKFLLGRKGISKKMIGEYLTSLQRPFNMAVLHCFVHEVDFSGLHIDIALRMLQQEVTLPGEAQKIEKMIEVFSKRYMQCNQMFVSGFKSPDTIFILSYAMVLLNTDLHSPAVRSSRKMKREDFVRNLRGVDGGNDLDIEMLRGIYDRIRTNEFRSGADHQSQVSKVEENIRGNYDKSIGGRLAEPHRRLVCFCRLTEVSDLNNSRRKEFTPTSIKKDNQHQRGVFLFNDILVVTKSLTKKKSLHQYRYCIPLRDLRVNTFCTSVYPHGIQIQDRFSGKILSTFDAKSETDQTRFVHDLQESVSETIEMDRARLFFDEPEEEML